MGRYNPVLSGQLAVSVLAAYVRKGTVPGVIESLNARAGTIEYAKR